MPQYVHDSGPSVKCHPTSKQLTDRCTYAKSLLMSEHTMTVTKCLCLRCQHAWWPRGAYLPVLCPSCKSKYWNQVREERDAVPQS
jgi:hypothetical protein